MESGGSLFRLRAVRASRLRWLGTVQVVMPPSARTAILVALTACSAVAAASIIVEIPDSVSAYGVLLPAEGLLKVRAPRAGRVEGLAVRNSDAVSDGSLLLRVSGLDHAPGHRPALTDRIASLGRERAMVLERLEHDLAASGARIESQRRRANLLEDRMGAARSELEMRQATARRYRARAARVAELAETGVIARHTVDELVASAMQAEATGLATAQNVAALEDEFLVIEEQLRQEAQMRMQLESDAGARLEAIDRDIGHSALESAVAVTAPDDGRVAGLTVRDGDVVRPGQVLLTLYDPAEPLEARLYLPASRAGAVTEGQTVELQLEAFPHEIHGTRTAVVTALSAAATPASEFATGLPISGPVFEIRASLCEPSVVARGRSWKLLPGTSFRAEIVARRWPLYRWLLRSRQERHAAY